MVRTVNVKYKVRDSVFICKQIHLLIRWISLTTAVESVLKHHIKDLKPVFYHIIFYKLDQCVNNQFLMDHRP